MSKAKLMPEFDLASIATVRADEGSPMPVTRPGSRIAMLNEDKTPVTITLLGRASVPFREVLRQVQLGRAQIAQRGEQLTEDDIFLEDTNTLTACTVNWTIRSLDGAAFPCNPQNIRKLWSDTRFRSLRDDALRFIVQDANFLPESSKISSAMPDTSSGSTSLSPTAEASS